MNTTFTLRLAGCGAEEARGMARECCERLDDLERKLSRFLDGSDVSRINRMRAGETLYLSEECHRCLLLAMEAHALTGGLFDVTLGTRIEHRKLGRPGPPPPVAGRLVLHREVPAVTCEQAGREVDLGGIGKGYALDELRKMLEEWGARGGLLASGASTLLAFGPDEWPVELAGDGEARRLALAGQALGASGTAVQGSHIVDPRDEGQEPADGAWHRAWVVAERAAWADAWSTAVMLMSAAELAAFLAQDTVARAVYVERGGRIECLRAPGP